MKFPAVSIFLLSSSLLGQVAFAQSISFGIRGGVPFTGGFSDLITTSSGSAFVRQFSNSNEYLIGPMVELHLPLGFSVEADALYHPLDLTQQINNGTSTLTSSTKINSWEFPILAKYHFLPFPIVKPYIEAGPSFRAIGSGINIKPSSTGFALGAGVEVKLLRLRIEPELRYIRWGADGLANGVSNLAAVAASNVNQVEFLVGIAF